MPALIEGVDLLYPICADELDTKRDCVDSGFIGADPGSITTECFDITDPWGLSKPLWYESERAERPAILSEWLSSPADNWPSVNDSPESEPPEEL